MQNDDQAWRDEPSGLTCYRTMITRGMEHDVVQEIWRSTQVDKPITHAELTGVIERAGFPRQIGREHYASSRAVDSILKRARRLKAIKPAGGGKGWLYELNELPDPTAKS